MPAFTASSTDATSAGITRVGQGDFHGASASGSSVDITSFQAETIGEGAELASTLFNDVEVQGVTKLRRRAGPRHRRAAASQELDEDVPSDDCGARLLAYGIANPGGAGHL